MFKSIYQKLSLSLIGIVGFNLASFVIVNPAVAQIRDQNDFFEQGNQQLEEEIEKLQDSQQQPTEPSLTVSSGTYQWSRAIIREADCAVWIPQGTLTKEEINLETATGDIKFQVMSSYPDESRFLVAYSEELNPQQLVNPQELLNRMRDRIATIQGKTTLFTMSDERDFTWSNSPAKDFVLKSEEQTITVRLILIKQRLYVLGVSQENNMIVGDAVTAFFQSFQLL